MDDLTFEFSTDDHYLSFMTTVCGTLWGKIVQKRQRDMHCIVSNNEVTVVSDILFPFPSSLIDFYKEENRCQLSLQLFRGSSDLIQLRKPLELILIKISF